MRLVVPAGHGQPGMYYLVYQRDFITLFQMAGSGPLGNSSIRRAALLVEVSGCLREYAWDLRCGRMTWDDDQREFYRLVVLIFSS
jgi:hypothetical protein